MKSKIFFIKGFLNNKKGSVTIEFFFMVLFLLIIFAFMVDLVLLRSTMGKLDNASYSLVNILRERNALSPGASVRINNTEYQLYEKLAKLLVFGDKDSKEKLFLVLESKDSSEQATVLGDTSKCSPYERIEDLWNLSPFSESNRRGVVSRKIPIYQVTICVETNSFFKRILLNDSERKENLVRSSSMSVLR